MEPRPSSSTAQTSSVVRGRLSSTQARDRAALGAKPLPLLQLAQEQVGHVPLHRVAAFAVENDVPSHLVPGVVARAAQTSIVLQPPCATTRRRSRTLARPRQYPDLETAQANIATSASRAAALSAAIGRLTELRTLLQSYLRDYGVRLPAVADRAQVWLDATSDAIASETLQLHVECLQNQWLTELVTRVNEEAEHRNARAHAARQPTEVPRLGGSGPARERAAAGWTPDEQP
jgi:hypothetical protein